MQTVYALNSEVAVIFTEKEGVTHSKCYSNSEKGRNDILNEVVDEELHSEIFGVWGEEPTVIPEKYVPDLESVKSQKTNDINSLCSRNIIEGVDVTLPSNGVTYHFALTLEDQTDISAAYAAVKMGETGFMYHADGEPCKFYPSEDIKAIAETATAHKVFQQTLANYLKLTVKRCVSVEEVDSITHTMESLPDDLKTTMFTELAKAQKAQEV